MGTAGACPELGEGFKPAEWLMLLSFGVYCFVFPFAVVLLSFDWMPFGMEWMSSLLVAALGLASIGWLWSNYGLAGLSVGTLIFSLSLGLEYIGVFTGFPFGTYKYTGVLIPELPGGVPLAIAFAWVTIVPSALFTVRWLVSPEARSAASLVKLSLLGALFGVGLDLLLEPVAFHIKNYWQWLPAKGGYYGIPWSNFLAWFFAALVFCLLVSGLPAPRKSLSWGWLPQALYGMNVVMFGVVNVAHGFWWPGLVALVFLGVMALGLRKRLRTED